MRKKLNPSKNRTFSAEIKGEMFGVSGLFMPRIYDEANRLFVSQVFKASRPFNADGYKKGSRITVEVRFDDECKNGSQSFAITGHVVEPGARDWAMGGCIHEEIRKYFPELAHLIKWHHMATDSPMHYVANTVYHASNLASGKAAGEPNAWERRIAFGDFPITHKIGQKFADYIKARIEHNATTSASNPHRLPFAPVAVPHDKKPGETYKFADKFTLAGFECKWYECQFDSENDAQEFCNALNSYPVRFVQVVTGYSEGKARDLDAARSCGVWPDATDEQLCVPAAELERELLARLPGLVAAFRADMDSAGLLWEDQPEHVAQ